jgi:hypothetical protein
VYSVEAQAFVPMSGNQSSCIPSDKIVSNINVAAGAITSVSLISFTGCQ